MFAVPTEHIATLTAYSSMLSALSLCMWTWVFKSVPVLDIFIEHPGFRIAHQYSDDDRQAGWPSSWSSIPSRGNRFFSSPEDLAQLWGPPCLVDIRIFFAGVKVTGWVKPSCTAKVKNCGAIPPLPHAMVMQCLIERGTALSHSVSIYFEAKVGCRLVWLKSIVLYSV